ncbi:ATP-binding protein [Candidatus Woesearchaeota archaeon]|nr:ATP-binding protein [Candidatus Woesearchaeota archaeon]
MKYILNSFGNIFSISAFEGYLKSNNVPHSMEDLYVIIKGIQDVFMGSFVKEYSKSFKKSEFSKSKIYLFDVGYIHFLANESEDYGRILENVVFIELFGREGNIENKSIFYFKSSAGRECDFVIKRKGKISQVIQVTKELNDKNKEREIEGMVTAMEFFKLKKGLILTFDQKDELIIDGKKIIVQPIWKWLLE